MSFRSLQGLLLSLSLAAAAGADIVIDDFSIAQGPLTLSSPGTVTDHNADNAAIFLGERNLRVERRGTRREDFLRTRLPHLQPGAPPRIVVAAGECKACCARHERRNEPFSGATAEGRTRA